VSEPGILDKLRAEIAEHERRAESARHDLAELQATRSDLDDVRPVPIHEALSEHKPEEEWLIEGLLPVRCIGLLTAEGGVGKSTLAAQICAGLSAGNGFFGFNAGRPIPTLFLEAEGSRERFVERIGVALVSLGIASKGLPMFVQPKAWRPSLNGTTADTIGICGAKLVVLDTIGLFEKYDENSATEFKQLVIGPLRRLAEKTGAGFLLIHHEGKPSEMRKGRHKIRGTSAFVDDTDLTIRLEAPDGQRAAYRQMIFEKIRHGQPQEPIDLSYDFSTATFSRDDGGREAAGPSEGECRKREATDARVLSVIKNTPRMSGRQIRLAANINTSECSSSMRRLQDGKRIAFEPGPKNSMLWIAI